MSGCLAERQQEALLEECPEIDQLVGVFGREQITKVADRIIGDLEEQRTVFAPAPVTALSDRQRFGSRRGTLPTSKYRKGAIGCVPFVPSRKCAAKHATKPIEEVVAEATELAAAGARELIIVAQDTTYYGMDLYGESRLVELLEQLETVEGIDWIRLMYLYPMYSGRRSHWADRGQLQNRALRRSATAAYQRCDAQADVRRVNRQETEALLRNLRAGIPDLVMRTTFITGFPGETDAQFAELAEFVQAQRFEHVGVFTYSFEPTTPSAALPDHLPEEVKQERRQRLMEIQQANVFARNNAQVGRQLEVLIDQPVAEQPNAWIARSYGEAPDVDSVIWVTGEDLETGQLVPVEIVATSDYDLVAAAIGPGSVGRQPIFRRRYPTTLVESSRSRPKEPRHDGVELCSAVLWRLHPGGQLDWNSVSPGTGRFCPERLAAAGSHVPGCLGPRGAGEYR